MSGCCSVRDGGDFAVECPRCGQPGDLVGVAPVQAHRRDEVDGPWRYCSTRECPVVFFLGTSFVDHDVVTAQVGSKAAGKPMPVCFCFAHTVEDLTADFWEHRGRSTIIAAVKAAVAGGQCACEYLNPTGRCCLVDVHRVVKQLRAEQLDQRDGDDGKGPIDRRS